MAISFCPQTGILWQNLYFFSSKAWELKVVILHILNWSFSHIKPKTILKKFAPLAAREFQFFFGHKTGNFALKKSIFWLNWQYSPGSARKLKILNYIFLFLFDPFAAQRKTITKYLAPLAAWAIFVCSLFMILNKKNLFLTKLATFFRQSMGT